MADRIKVSAIEMQQAITEYKGAHEIMDEAFAEMEQAMEHLHACWDGPAKMIFIAKWAAVYSNIRKSDAVIQKSINGLSNTVRIMNAGEDTVFDLAATLEEGTTPPIF